MFFVLSLFLACSAKPEERIVGKWSQISTGWFHIGEIYVESTRTKLEFFKDGTLLIASHLGNMVGKYAVIDKDRIKMEVGNTSQIAIVFISNDELILGDLNGMISKFKREK